MILLKFKFGFGEKFFLYNCKRCNKEIKTYKPYEEDTDHFCSFECFMFDGKGRLD